MPKSPRPPRKPPVYVPDVTPPPVHTSPPATDLGPAAYGINPILYQAVALPLPLSLPVARMRLAAGAEEPHAAGAPAGQGSATPNGGATAPPMIVSADGTKGFVSVLSRKLPEPTSYAGRNIIAVNLDASFFREGPNQAEPLVFDGKSTYVDLENPAHLQGGRSSNSLTIECWIRMEHAAMNSWQHIVTHGQRTHKHPKAEVLLRICNGCYEFGTWNGVKVHGCDGATVGRNALGIRNEDVNVWVHLAGVYDDTAKTYTLYRNGVALASVKADVGPLSIDANWFVGAISEQDENSGKTQMGRLFAGNIAELRIWTVARSVQQLRDGMTASSPSAAPGELAAYLPLTGGPGLKKDQNKVRDISGRQVDGTIKGAVVWRWGTNPIGEMGRLTRRQPPHVVKDAFDLAKATGFFDSLVFPRLAGVRTDAERKANIAALKDLSIQTFQAFYDAGQHLVLRRSFSGVLQCAFIPNPPEGSTPRILILEDYRLSSFLGAYGVGRTLRSFSLLPGERTTLTIKTASKTEEMEKKAQSILDSYSQESASEFESSLSEERSHNSSSSDEWHAEASVEASGSWGFGSASGKASGGGSGNSAREEFAKSVASATSKHAAKASANRNVKVDTTTEKKTTTEQTSEIVREIENINVGRTLNFVFCQMNQEYISLLHLIDVRIAFHDGIEIAREVPLYELPDLLGAVMVDDASKRAQAQAAVLDCVQHVRDFQGSIEHDFVTEVDGSPGRFRVNKDKASTFGDPTSDTAPKVPGVIVSAKSIVMRTEDVAVDAIIGSGSALDGYAEKLQQEENRARKLANDRLEAENRLLELEAARSALLMDLVKSRDVELLKAYSRALTMSPSGNQPNRVISVWEPEATDGSKATVPVRRSEVEVPV